MLKLALRNLLHDRGRLAISVAGVAVALLLVLILDGVFAGTSEQIVAYPRHAGADVWVMQPGVANMHMTTSTLARDREDAVRDVPGVEHVAAILYVNNFVHAGGKEWFSYIVGVRPGDPLGGPWSTAAGERIPGAGQVVLPRVLAAKSGVSEGDTVHVMGRALTIVGTSHQTFSMANSVTFVAYDDLRDLMAATDQVSYLLVAAAEGVEPDALASRINRDVTGVHAMSRTAFVDSDRKMALQMGVDVVRIMTFVGFVVSILIIGFMTYTAALRRRRELAVVKALGGRNRALVAATIAQTAVVTACAFALAVALAYALRPLIHTIVPEVEIIYPGSTLFRVAVAALAIGVLASWIPARRLMRIDPALVFRA